MGLDEMALIKAVVSKFIVSQARPYQIQQKTQLFFKISSKVTNFACANRQMQLLSCMTCSLVPSPSQLYCCLQYE